MDDPIKRLNECIDQHNRTGYSGVLKWVELVAIRDALGTAQSKVEAYNMVDHCCCRFEEDGETRKAECSIHHATRIALETAQAEYTRLNTESLANTLRLLARISELEQERKRLVDAYPDLFPVGD